MFTVRDHNLAVNLQRRLANHTVNVGGRHIFSAEKIIAPNRDVNRAENFFVGGSLGIAVIQADMVVVANKR